MEFFVVDRKEWRSVPRLQNKTSETPVGPGLLPRLDAAAKPSARRGTRDRQALQPRAPAHEWIPEPRAVQGLPRRLRASGRHTGTTGRQPSGQENDARDLGLRGRYHATWRKPKTHRSSGRRLYGCRNLQRTYCSNHLEKSPSRDHDCRVQAGHQEHFLHSLQPSFFRNLISEFYLKRGPGPARRASRLRQDPPPRCSWDDRHPWPGLRHISARRPYPHRVQIA